MKARKKQIHRMCILLLCGVIFLGFFLTKQCLAQSGKQGEAIRVTVKAGDTLAKLAEKYLGDPKRWKEIAEWNKIPPPYQLRVGQVLSIRTAKAEKSVPPRPRRGEREQRLSVFPSAGILLSQSQLSPSPVVGLEMGYILPWLGRRMAATCTVEWFGPAREGDSDDSRILEETYHYEIRSAVIPVLFGVRYFFPVKNPLSVSGFLRLGPAYARVETTAFDFAVEETDTVLAASTGAAIGVQAGPGAVSLEAAYQYSGVDFISSGEQNISGPRLLMGYFFAF